MSQASLPAFCCPLCRGTVAEQDSPPAYSCSSCGRSYPVVLGIPDFRVWPDPYISPEEDWAKATELQRRSEGGGLRKVLELYWHLTPDVPVHLADRFVRYGLVGAARGRARLESLARASGRPLGSDDVLLDLGCGTGGLLETAGRRAGAVVGVDIAARWLVVARRRLEQDGLHPVLLVCACAERLPFPDESFSAVVAEDVLEHSQRQSELLREIRRSLTPRGLALIRTQNRWSLAGEPHVRLWGVGFMPRSWMSSYVQLARGLEYRLIRLVSSVELERLVRHAGLATARRLVPRVGPAELAGLQCVERCLARIYALLATLPPLRPLILLFGPALEVVVRRTGPVAAGKPGRPAL